MNDKEMIDHLINKKASILQRTMIQRLTNFVYFGEPLNSSLDDFLEIASYIEVYTIYSALLKLVQNRFIGFEKNANDNAKKKLEDDAFV